MNDRATEFIVLENEQNRSLLQRFLVREGFSVRLARTPAEAVRLAGRLKPQVIIADKTILSGYKGGDFAAEIRRADASLRSLIITSEEERGTGKSSSEHFSLSKPYSLPRLREVLAAADLNRK